MPGLGPVRALSPRTACARGWPPLHSSSRAHRYCWSWGHSSSNFESSWFCPASVCLSSLEFFTLSLRLCNAAVILLWTWLVQSTLRKPCTPVSLNTWKVWLSPLERVVAHHSPYLARDLCNVVSVASASMRPALQSDVPPSHVGCIPVTAPVFLWLWFQGTSTEKKNHMVQN